MAGIEGGGCVVIAKVPLVGSAVGAKVVEVYGEGITTGERVGEEGTCDSREGIDGDVIGLSHRVITTALTECY